MVEVKEATYVPGSGGGEIQAVMTVGNQEVKSTLPIGSDDAFLRSLLDDLTLRVERITFLPGPSRREVHVTMTMGGQSYISHLPLDEHDNLIAPSIDRLLQAVGTRFMRTLETSLQQGTAGETESAGFPGPEPA
jgi:hypothetical protein